jgi:hypothetical protein
MQVPRTATEKTEVKVTAAKDRPMLTWVGKSPLTQVTAFPAQLVERHTAIDILGIQNPGEEDDSYGKRMEVLRPHRNAKCWDDQPCFHSRLAPEGETTVAVRITDMLGEEVLVTAEV